MNTKIQILIIILATLLAYSNIFSNNFATDDIGYIYNWKITKSTKNIPKILTTDSVPQDEKGVYRPVKALFLMVSFFLWGFNPVGYHINSIVIHLINSILIYLISFRITKKRLIAFISGLFFGLHPIHTEAITFILASFDSIGLTFYLISFWAYLRSKDSSKRLPYYIVSVVTATIAFFTYELTLSLPLIILLHYLCFQKNIFKKNSFKKLLLIAPFIISLIFYLFVRVWVLQIFTRNAEYLGGSFYLTMLIMTRAAIKYIYLLILPVNLSLNHKMAPGVYSLVNETFLNMKTFKSQSIFDPVILFNIVVIISLLIIAIKSYQRKPIITFIIGWFFITLLPVSSLIPNSTIFAERYAYLASFSYFMLLGYLSYIVYNRFKAKNVKIILICLLAVVSLAYGYRTYLRNKDWKDTLTVWNKLASQNPDDPQTNINLGKIYLEQNQNKEAIKYFNKAALAQNEGFYKIHSLNPMSRSYKNTLDNLSRFKYPLKIYSKDNTDYIYFSNQDNSLGFYFPLAWNIKSPGKSVILEDSDLILNAVIEIGDRSNNLAPKSYGTLLNQGLARIPNVESASVKVWEDNGVKKLEFFLFKKNKVVNILVFPGDSPHMKEFDQILSTIIIN